MVLLHTYCSLLSSIECAKYDMMQLRLRAMLYLSLPFFNLTACERLRWPVQPQSKLH